MECDLGEQNPSLYSVICNTIPVSEISALGLESNMAHDDTAFNALSIEQQKVVTKHLLTHTKMQRNPWKLLRIDVERNLRGFSNGMKDDLNYTVARLRIFSIHHLPMMCDATRVQEKGKRASLRGSASFVPIRLPTI